MTCDGAKEELPKKNSKAVPAGSFVIGKLRSDIEEELTPKIRSWTPDVVEDSDEFDLGKARRQPIPIERGAEATKEHHKKVKQISFNSPDHVKKTKPIRRARGFSSLFKRDSTEDLEMDRRMKIPVEKTERWTRLKDRVEFAKKDKVPSQDSSDVTSTRIPVPTTVIDGKKKNINNDLSLLARRRDYKGRPEFPCLTEEYGLSIPDESPIRMPSQSTQWVRGERDEMPYWYVPELDYAIAVEEEVIKQWFREGRITDKMLFAMQYEGPFGTYGSEVLMSSKDSPFHYLDSLRRTNDMYLDTLYYEEWTQRIIDLVEKHGKKLSVDD